ncbi:putative ABC transport system ATP-binding protein [Evansella caseinilytica]|uniref:Putative ABC transport system ATP-binding protein n=1 Tax=Evansella caseinilytica TaxID=1503961 RepID=A0A1H3UWT3_9BACI|nr:ATP-binding cassette domain-containing protein [Evansella caseinilytica]SDZ66902.1 putative ABC transport system ATP-binding protein [Evansella caseinilytica]
MGITEAYFHRLPASLSGGEKQRVAIARSLIADPQLLLCDEPTGNLDVDNRNQIVHVLQKLKAKGRTLLVVTHDLDVAKQGDHILELRDGTLKEVVIGK